MQLHYCVCKYFVTLGIVNAYSLFTHNQSSELTIKQTLWQLCDNYKLSMHAMQFCIKAYAI